MEQIQKRGKNKNKLLVNYIMCQPKRLTEVVKDKEGVVARKRERESLVK